MSRFLKRLPSGLRECYVMKQSDDFKLPRNTVKRMRKSEKTLKIETRNQFENLMEEDIDEDHRPMEEEDKQVEGTRTTKTTTKSPAKVTTRLQTRREKISPLIIREKEVDEYKQPDEAGKYKV
ncbi:hypothetical protein HHI36_002857 [Cryptolaemus montrouzieri]|uniref:Uncharacterized protein n=1 Tax=Cryptolaemus montrouzieri TaxID=559131 RepID=A0ABD2PBN3_9CUCU